MNDSGLVVDASGTSPIVLGLRGPLDLVSAPSFEGAAASHLATDDVDVDMSELTFIDSTGLNALVALHEQAKSAGRSLRILRPTTQARKLMALTQLDELIPVVDE